MSQALGAGLIPADDMHGRREQPRRKCDRAAGHEQPERDVHRTTSFSRLKPRAAPGRPGDLADRLDTDRAMLSSRAQEVMS